MSEERFKDALKQIDKMNFNTGRADLLGLEIREIIRRSFHPDEPCPKCRGAGEVPNTSKWCVFEKEGPMTLKCLKFNKYVQNSNICRDCDDYTAKYPKMKCPSCMGKKEKVVIAHE
jgi:hypothetical protein